MSKAPTTHVNLAMAAKIVESPNIFTLAMNGNVECNTIFYRFVNKGYKQKSKLISLYKNLRHKVLSEK